MRWLRSKTMLKAEWSIKDQDPDKLDLPFPNFNPHEIFDEFVEDRALSPRIEPILVDQQQTHPPTLSLPSTTTVDPYQTFQPIF